MKWWLASFVLVLVIGAPSAAGQDRMEGTLEVEINGVSGRDATNVRNRLSIYEYHESESRAGRVLILHRRAEQEILRALAPGGYYQARVESDLERTDTGWRAIYNIQPGPPILIRSVDIQVHGEANEDPAFQRLIAILNLLRGQRLHHSNYESAKSQLRAMATERGYNEAFFDRSELQIDLRDYAADIVLHLDSGPRYRFGEVVFSEAHIDESVLQRFVTFEEGDFITSDSLLELQRGLTDSNYFRSVQIQPQWQEAGPNNREVPVAVTLEENNRTAYRAGLGYGSDTGIRVRFDQNRRWLNRRGHRFNAEVQVSEILSTVAANYVVPGSRPQTDNYTLHTSWRDENTDTTETELITLGANWQKQLARTQRTFSLHWQDERDRFEGERRRTQFLIPGAQWNRIHTANRMNVRSGYRARIGVQAASEAILSATDFAQINLDVKWVTSFAEHFRLLARGEFGATYANDFSQIPTSLRFYAGGDHSVRGYGYRTIGPRTEEGFMLGGRHLIVGSAEVDYEFQPNWRIAVFIDSGNAFDDITSPMRTGAGISARWQSPIGPIRIDLAHGFSDMGDTVRLHLTLGPDL